MSFYKIIHLGCMGTASILCGAPERRNLRFEEKNWTLKSEKVTCKRCLAKIKKLGRDLSFYC
jgi:hypothetical protein